MTICVNLRLLGIFQRLSGKKKLKIEIEEPFTVKKVVILLYGMFSIDFEQVLVDSQLNEPRAKALILVGGKEISVLNGLETVVRDDEEIILILIVHGG